MIGLPFEAIPCDRRGRLDVAALERRLAAGGWIGQRGPPTSDGTAYRVVVREIPTTTCRGSPGSNATASPATTSGLRNADPM